MASVGVARRSGGRRGAGSVRLSIRRWRGIFFDGHAEFVEGARVFRVFGRDAFLDGLSAFELRPGIEEAALLTAMQFGLTLGARSAGIESGSEDGAAIGTARARDGADHAGCAGTELIGAPRPPSRGLAVV